MLCCMSCVCVMLYLSVWYSVYVCLSDCVYKYECVMCVLYVCRCLCRDQMLLSSAFLNCFGTFFFNRDSPFDYLLASEALESLSPSPCGRC
jgi:hypothetical protein